jgi:hypothetical protein
MRCECRWRRVLWLLCFTPATSVQYTPRPATDKALLMDPHRPNRAALDPRVGFLRPIPPTTPTKASASPIPQAS